MTFRGWVELPSVENAPRGYFQVLMDGFHTDHGRSVRLKGVDLIRIRYLKSDGEDYASTTLYAYLTEADRYAPGMKLAIDKETEQVGAQALNFAEVAEVDPEWWNHLGMRFKYMVPPIIQGVPPANTPICRAREYHESIMRQRKALAQQVVYELGFLRKQARRHPWSDSPQREIAMREDRLRELAKKGITP